MKDPVRVAVTGAAGQIGYALLFRIAAGEMLGKDQPVILNLLEITPALGALNGVAMELDDCAFPLLRGMVCTDDPAAAFQDADYALLVGSRPRTKGMERKDLLEANAAIFSVQGKALNAAASREVKVLVVGNPANTNCLAMNLIDMAWYEGEFIPSVQQRGAAIIEARGASSAASAANAAIEHMRDWALGSPAVLSMGVRSDDSYGVAEGLIYSYPVRCRDGDWQILDGIAVNNFSRARMQATFDGKRWQGDIYDPEGGGTYTSRLWVDAGGDLRVRGYLGIPLLGRTAVFKPVSLCADHIAEKLEKAGLGDCGTPTAPTALESARQ